MKRHISIFALLLSALAAVGSAAGTIQRVLVVSTLKNCVKDLSLSEKGPGGSYYSLGGAPLTAKELTGYRFLGWYTTSSDCNYDAATPENCTALLTPSSTISSTNGAKICTINSSTSCPLLCPKFQKTYVVTTSVSPADAGKVTVEGGNRDGTVDAGGSVTLTATANTGWEFSKWSDNVTTNPRTIDNIKADATYTAVFATKVNAITSGPTIGNWTYGETPKAPSAQAKYTGSTGMTYTYYDSSKTSLGSQPPTNAGTYYIRATSPSSDEYDSATSDYVQFSISKKTINTDSVSFSSKSVTYTGGEQKIEASSVPNGVTVTYENNTRTAVGEQTATAKFTAADSANCQVTTASKTAKLTITAATITGVTLKSSSITYDGQPHQPTVASVTANGKTFSASGTGWTVVYLRNSVETSDFTNAGTITVKVTGTGNLTGSSSADFTIGKREISLDGVVFADLTVTYDGTEKVIKASNVPSGVTATYSSNKRTAAGEQQARVTFEPNDKNHTVSLNQKLATLKIEQATITEVALNGTAATYDGQSHKPAIGWVTANNKTFSNSSTGWDVTYLRNGSATGDFTSPGTITVTATGNTNLKGSKSATFTINKATIESVTLATVSTTYDGKPHQPVVNSVTASGKGFTSESTGWTVAYTRGGTATTDFTKAGTITVTVTGKTALSGSASATFNIAKKTISTTGVGFSDKLVTYDGTAKSITASSVPDGVKATYSNNSRTDAGSQTATVNFEPTDKENCTVSPTSKTATLTVNPATISAIALSATSATYDGQPHQPQVVSVTANGKTFTDSAIGWDVAYDKTDFTSVGRITVTATGKKNLTGSANATFEIKSKSITVTFDPNGGNPPSPTSKTVQCPGTYGTLPTCTRKGYRLTGWWTAKEGGTEITETTTVELTAAQTLYAQWEARTFKLNVDPNGGYYEDVDIPQEVGNLIFNETNLNRIAVAIHKEKDGPPLMGYYLGTVKVYDANGRNVTNDSGDYWTADYPDGKFCFDDGKSGDDGKFTAITVKAVWGRQKDWYDITAIASPTNGGTVSGGGHYEDGSNIVLSATENTGYSFWHWTKNGTEVSTAKEYPITVNANVEYTAVFTGNVYKIQFMRMDGGPEDLIVDEIFGEYWKLPTVQRTGYVAEWYSLPMGQGEQITAETLFDRIPQYPFVYAKWIEVPPTVTFADPEGGNESIPEERTKGQPIGEPAKGTEGWRRDGYWRDNDSDWDPPLSTVVTGNMTVNAKWTSIADVLDCTNLLFNAVGNWEICTDDFVVGDSCMKLPKSDGNDLLSVTITEPGTLRFNWKVDVNAKFVVSTDGTDVWLSEEHMPSKWSIGQQEAIELSSPCELRFYCVKGSVLDYCQIDNVTWTPKGEEKKYTLTITSAGNGAVDPTSTNAVKGTSVKITATPDAGYAFEKWSDGSTENPRQILIESNATYVATFTELPPVTYTVMLNANGGTGGSTAVTATYGEALPTLDNLPSREGYALTGYFDAASGGVKYYDANGTGARNWDRTADAELYAQWEEVKVVDEIARALDCEDSGLTFEMAGDWSVITNESFAKKGDSYLSDLPDEAKLKTTISQSGTLTFWWKAPKADFTTVIIEVETNGQHAISCKFKDTTEEWKSETLYIDASQGEVELTFISGFDFEEDYRALDFFTWTPEGKEPEYADVDTPVTGFSMADGKIGFSFVGDGSSTYHILGTNDVTAPWMSWPFVREIKAGETQPVQIDIKADEPKMFYRIRALK